MEDVKMKAIVYTKYGAPEDVLELKEVEKPTARAPKHPHDYSKDEHEEKF